MKRIAVMLEKGGSGKSLVARELAVGLAALKHQRVLCGDMDPQGNLTKALTKFNKPLSIEACLKVEEEFNKSERRFEDALLFLKTYALENIYKCEMSTVLENPGCIKDAILHTDIQGLDVIPASHKLTESDMRLKLNSHMNPCGKLAKALNSIDEDYDFAIIDNPPFTNALLYNAVYSCSNEGDLIIIPVNIDAGGIEGLVSTVANILETVEEAGLDCDFKILPTMVQNNNEDKAAIKMLRTLFKDRVFNTIIKFQGKPVKNASLNKKYMVTDDNKSKVADDLRALVNEISALYKVGE